MKRKNNALLLSVLLVLTVVFLTNPAYAISTGWERYQDDKCEIYLEYFPVFLFDPYYPTASEEFAIKYYIMQDSFWMDPLNKFVPWAFKIRAGYRDVTDGSLDWTEWKRWYPLSMKQHGMDIVWRLMYGEQGLTFGAAVSVSKIASTKTNYTQDEWVYNGNTYMFLGSLSVTYASNVFWNQASCEAGGSINIPNDLAMNKEGHHVEVLVEVTTWWIDWIDTRAPRVYKHPPVYFVLGDDNPATTDCWLTVEEGTVGFGEGGSPQYLTISAGTGGTTQPPPSTRVYDDGESVEVTASAYSHYVFDHWILDGAKWGGNPLTVTMNSNHALTPYFTWFNNPPNTPSKPSGPTSGYTSTSYRYSTRTTDPNGDNVRYRFGWGDGTYTTTGFYGSGNTVSRSHSWGSTGTYYVTVKAQDSYGAWSDGWSSLLKVTISKEEGGGGGCPTLFVWNGIGYAEEGFLDIHAESDVTVQHEIQNTLALENGVYNLQLRELDEFTSHIDQAKLYAVDGEGEWHLCPLTYAYHNELGRVKHTLRFDDSDRVDLEPTEIIDLKFGLPIPHSETAYFVFEINGYNMKIP